MMKIQLGQVKYKDRDDLKVEYGTVEDGTMYFFMKSPDKKDKSVPLENGSRIATTELVEAVDNEKKHSHIGLISSDGRVIIPFDNKTIKEISNGILLVEISTPKSSNVIKVNELKNDPASATSLVATPAAIKDKMATVMSKEARYVFNDLFSEAYICDLEGRQLVDGLFSFIAVDKTNNKIYMSKNSKDEQIVEYSILPPEVNKGNEEKIDVRDVNVSQDAVEEAMTAVTTPETEPATTLETTPVVDAAPMADTTTPAVEETTPATTAETTPETVPVTTAETTPVEATTPVTVPTTSIVDETAQVPTTPAVGDGVPFTPVTPIAPQEDAAPAASPQEGTTPVVEAETTPTTTLAQESSAPATSPVSEEAATTPDTTPETTPETEPVTEEETTPVTEPETEPETVPETEPVTKVETTPETAPETEPETVPVVEEDEATTDIFDSNTDPFTGVSVIPPFEDKKEDAKEEVNDDNSLVDESSKVKDLSDDLGEIGDVFKDNNAKNDSDIDTEDYFNINTNPPKEEDTVIEDGAKLITELMAQSQKQKELIDKYRETLKKAAVMQKSYVEKNREQSDTIRELSNKNRELENTVTKDAARIQLFESKVREQERIISSQTREIGELRPQLAGKEELAKVLSDARVFLNSSNNTNDSYSGRYRA